MNKQSSENTWLKGYEAGSVSTRPLWKNHDLWVKVKKLKHLRNPSCYGLKFDIILRYFIWKLLN